MIVPSHFCVSVEVKERCSKLVNRCLSLALDAALMAAMGTTKQGALQPQKGGAHTAGLDAAARFCKLDFFEEPALGWWQTPVQEGRWPQAAEAVDSLAAGLLRLGLPSKYVRKKLHLKVKSQLQGKEAEILAVKEIMEQFVNVFELVKHRSTLVLTEEEKEFFSTWDAYLGEPVSLELFHWLYSQQLQFVERLDKEKSRLETI